MKTIKSLVFGFLWGIVGGFGTLFGMGLYNDVTDPVKRATWKRKIKARFNFKKEEA